MPNDPRMLARMLHLPATEGSFRRRSAMSSGGRGPLSGLSLLDRLALTTSPVPVAGDIIGGAADAKALLNDPNWTDAGLAAVGLLPFVPSGMRVLKNADEVSPRFKSAVQKELDKGANLPASREAIIEMEGDDFLRLVPGDQDKSKLDKLRDALGPRKEDLDEIPTLFVDDTGDVVQIAGHEGRHRIRALKEIGEKKIPVRIVRSMKRGEFKNPGEVVPEYSLDAYRISQIKGN